MEMSICNSRKRLAEENSDRVKYLMEKRLHKIYKHFDDQELIDVTFQLSNPTAIVKAHRVILSAASSYFEELFKSEKSVSHPIEINEIDSDTFQHLITFCYNGKTFITLDNVEEMFKAALFLQLDDAVANCVDFIIDHITDYTLKRAYDLKSETQNDLLGQKILEYEIRNFMKLIQGTEFLNFDAGILEKILESDDLEVKSEEDVFEAIRRWYEHDASARSQQLPALIGCLRLTQFDTSYLMSKIYTLPGCHVLALEAVTWVNAPLARSKLTLKYTKPRRRQSKVSDCCNSVADEDFMALNIKRNVGGIYQYNKTEDIWRKWCDIKIDAIFFGVIYMKGNLIFIGGYRNNNATDEVSCWNFKTKTFKQLFAMKQRRYCHNVVLLNDKIYAIGGMDNHSTALQSVEAYSVANGWQPIKHMSTARYGAAAVTLNGKIYVMGGLGEYLLKSVEFYDPTTGCWAHCADMIEEHRFPDATVHKGQIFVVGGFNGYHHRTVEQYNPQKNKWTKICCLNTGRANLSCISIYNELWAIGGWVKDCVSVYDDHNDKWIERSPMPAKGEYYCFSVPRSLLQRGQQM